MHFFAREVLEQGRRQAHAPTVPPRSRLAWLVGAGVVGSGVGELASALGWWGGPFTSRFFHHAAS